MYFYAGDLNEPKYQFLIKKREDVGIKHVNNPKYLLCVLQYNNYKYDG